MRIVVPALLLICLAFSAPALATQEEIDAVLEKLEPVFVKGNQAAIIKAAEKLFATLPEQNRDGRQSCLGYVADAKFTQGDKKGAYAALDAMRELDDKSAVYITVRTSIRTRDGQADAAFEECRKDARALSDDTRRARVDRYCRETYARSRQVAPKTLWQAFDSNEVAAEDQYKGKLLALQGKIAAIATSPLGYPELTFAVDRTGISTVKCQFPKDARAEIGKLKRGQTVTVAGVCRGFVLKTQVTVDACWLLD